MQASDWPKFRTVAAAVHAGATMIMSSLEIVRLARIKIYYYRKGSYKTYKTGEHNKAIAGG